MSTDVNDAPLGGFLSWRLRLGRPAWRQGQASTPQELELIFSKALLAPLNNCGVRG
jgi:hypothetical protein